MPSAIETRELSKKYGKHLALDKLTLTIPHGQFLGFLGPNGAGKTTTIKILTNLIFATEGEAYINGISVSDDPKKALLNVGAVVETPDFYPYLTPIEIFEYIGTIRNMTKSEINERSKKVLEDIKMNEWANTKIGKFSKGMKQRIAIGCALLHEPEILILDEPTGGLDPRGMAEVRDLLISLKKNNTLTIFMSSHMLNEVQELCDHIAMINYGKLLAYDTPENLRARLKTSRIEVSCLNEITAELWQKLSSISGIENLERTGEKMFAFLTKSTDEEEKYRLLNELMSNGICVTSFKESGIMLEKIYLDMIKESR